MKTIDEIRRQNLAVATKRMKTATALAKKAEVSEAYLSQIKNMQPESKTGKPKAMGDDVARKIERAIGEPLGWMDVDHSVKGETGHSVSHVLDKKQSVTGTYNDGGQLTMSPASPFYAESAQELPQPTEEEFAFVPQLDVAAACGEGRFVDHVVVKGGLAFKRSSLRDFGVPEHAARIIYASGGSMAPTVQDGRVVLLNTADKDPRDGKVYAICTPDGGLVLKRLVRDYHPAIGGQAWLMRSDNPDKTAHPDKVLPPDDRTMIVGRAVWNDNTL